MQPSRFQATWLLGVALILALMLGCSKFKLRSQTPDEEDEITEVKTNFVGDRVTVSGLNEMMIEGVGLVTGLHNTGGDPPSSFYRTMLIDEMKKRGVSNPNEVLARPDTALVLVRAILPPFMSKGDNFDVEVIVPDGGAATSLEGGFLMPVYLAERAVAPGGRSLKGNDIGIATGPILLAQHDSSKAATSGASKRGRIISGGRYTGGLQKQDRKLRLFIRNEHRSFRNSKRLADRIGKRFNGYDHGQLKPLSRAMNDQEIELKIDPRYRDNYLRYVNVVRAIAVAETQEEELARLRRLKTKLLAADTAGKAAVELEAIGAPAIPILQEGLNSRSPEVRVYSAHALAYLGDRTGLVILAQAAREEPAFRAQALAALSTIDDSKAHVLLRKLTDGVPLKVQGTAAKNPESEIVQVSAEVKASDDDEALVEPERRYGAFRAMHILNKNDPYLRGRMINPGPKEFMLHALESKGEPMVHLCRQQHAEVVVFGADQRIRTPFSLTIGHTIVATAKADAETCTVSRFTATDDQDETLTVSCKLVDVIAAAGQLGASYPDIVGMLQQANRGKNLAGTLEYDALPNAGRVYYRTPDDLATASNADKTAKVGTLEQAPNLFGRMTKTSAFRGLDKVTDDSQPGDESTSTDTEDSDTADDQEKKKSGWSRWVPNPGKWFSGSGDAKVNSDDFGGDTAADSDPSDTGTDKNSVKELDPDSTDSAKKPGDS